MLTIQETNAWSRIIGVISKLGEAIERFWADCYIESSDFKDVEVLNCNIN